MPLGCLPLILFVWLVLLLPLFLADVMLTALGKLGLSIGASIYVLFWIFFGSLINLPIKKIKLNQPQEYIVYPFFGLNNIIKNIRQSQHMIIAVNVGGCLVPLTLCVYELFRLARLGIYPLIVCILATALNVFVCYKFSKPVPRVGIMMPPLIPAVCAAVAALLFLPDFAPPLAFTAGVLGPIIGADLLHLKDLRTIDSAMISIGGAGTFDGIVISGLFAALLA